MPIVIIPRLLLSLLSWLILAAAAYLLWSWLHGYDVLDAQGLARHVHGQDWRLYTGLGLLAWSFLGRFVVLLFIPAGRDEPREERSDRRGSVVAPDGSALNVESFGLASGPTLVLTHGWGLNSTAWWYAKRALSERFRLVTWDLPGLGRSRSPSDGKLTIERFAQALGAVVESTGSDKVVLVGHSIGGMTTQTLWRACPHLRSRVAGMVLIDTTHEDPIQTMWLAPLWRALRRPLIEPVLWLTIALWPMAWLSSWQGYLSGSNQLATRLTGFGRFATRGQVDFSARLACKGSPSVQAKGDLAMFRWRATEVLPVVTVPVLVLTGSRDIVTLPEASRFIVGSLPNGRLETIDGCGHMGFLERSQAYNEPIAHFAAPLLDATPAPSGS